MSIDKSTNTRATKGSTRWVVVAVMVLGAFFGAYGFAQARSARVSSSASVVPAAPTSDQSGALPSGSGGSGCACCGSTAPTENGVTGSPSEGQADESGGVQSVSVDLSKGYYEPNVIKLKAGVPAEITFGQSSGCTGQVISNDLGFFEDLTAGPRTVKLSELKAGTYSFSCGMQMVFGKIVVE